MFSSYVKIPEGSNCIFWCKWWYFSTQPAKTNYLLQSIKRRKKHKFSNQCPVDGWCWMVPSKFPGGAPPKRSAGLQSESSNINVYVCLLVYIFILLYFDIIYIHVYLRFFWYIYIYIIYGTLQSMHAYIYLYIYIYIYLYIYICGGQVTWVIFPFDKGNLLKPSACCKARSSIALPRLLRSKVFWWLYRRGWRLVVKRACLYDIPLYRKLLNIGLSPCSPGFF